MPAAKTTAETGAPEAPEAAPAATKITTVAAPLAISGLSRRLSKAADAAVFGGAPGQAPALSALTARMDDVMVALPAALAVADGDLKDALTALSVLLN